ncbi:Zn-dependent hydrolase [Bacteroidota bacterium]
MKNRLLVLMIIAIAITFSNCKQEKKTPNMAISEIKEKVDAFVKVKLTSDITQLSDNEKQMIGIFIEVAKIMEDIYWTEAYGNKNDLMNSIDDQSVRDFIKINYGPWERLNGNKSFITEIGTKPPGAQFYPDDITKEEFEKFDSEDKTSLYTVVRRDNEGKLITIPYHEYYKKEITKAANLIDKAAVLADDPGLKKYLELRSKALLTDEYYESDIAWMEMRDNTIDFIVGPIENYEDALFGYKAAHESFVLIKDIEWSKMLDKFSSMLPELQKTLPVSEKYKKEAPGSDSDIGVYDAVYYGGDCNAGSKTIAINLPNDEKVQTQKGTRKLQLKNSMQYKFDKILLPISKVLVAEDQQKYIKFDAFFQNTMFHEVAHGMGIKNTINGKGTVRKALKEQYSGLEEGKADIVGLYLITKLYEMGEFPEKNLMDNYVTMLAGLFRSSRFGVSSSHGKANMVRFYYFKEMGAFVKDTETGRYSVDFDKMTEAMISLSEKILIIQGNGDYEAAKKMIDEMGFIREDLQKDLDLIAEKGIPKDLVFEQGAAVLGL